MANDTEQVKRILDSEAATREKKLDVLSKRESIVDSLIPSPKIRSEKIWTLIQPMIKEHGISNWDLICFCISYLAGSCSLFTWMKDAVLKVGQLHYQAHYFATESLGLYGLNEDGEPIKEAVAKLKQTVNLE